MHSKPSKTVKRRPPPPRDNKVQRVELRLTPDEVACLDELASTWDVTRTEAVRLAVDKAIDKLKLRRHPGAKAVTKAKSKAAKAAGTERRAN